MRVARLYYFDGGLDLAYDYMSMSSKMGVWLLHLVKSLGDEAF